MPEGITSLPVNIITYKVNVNQWMRFKLNIENFFFFEGMEEKKQKSRKKSVVVILIYKKNFRVSSYLVFVPVTAAISLDFVHSY